MPNDIKPEKAEANDWMPQNQERRVANSLALYQDVKYNKQVGMKPPSVTAMKNRVARYPL